MWRQTNPVFTVAIVAVGVRYMGTKSTVSMHNLAILTSSVHHRIKPKTVFHRALM